MGQVFGSQAAGWGKLVSLFYIDTWLDTQGALCYLVGALCRAHIQSEELACHPHSVGIGEYLSVHLA